MQEFPMFFGIDHHNLNLTVRMKKLLEEHYVKGARLFTEGSPEIIKKFLSEKIIEYPFHKLITLAHEKGMEIVPLDKTSHVELVIKEIGRHVQDGIERTKAGHISQGLPDAAPEQRYSEYNIRERHWALVLKNARRNDLVVMHPAHLKHLQKELGIPQNRMIYYPKSSFKFRTPLSSRNLKKFLRKRFIKRELSRTNIWPK